MARRTRGAGARRLVGATARPSTPAASRSSSRTTTTRTSTTPPRSCSRCGGRASAARCCDRAVAWVAGDAVEGRWLGRVRRRQHERPPGTAAVLRLRGGDRSAERRRHRARARDAGARGTRGDGARAAAVSSTCLREQTREGSWFGRWGANHVYGTGAAVPALVACGLGRHESVTRAVGWLGRVQNEDGGFGEDMRSYRDDTWRGRGASTASQTAWALLALHAAGERRPGHAAGGALARGDATRGRQLGRAVATRGRGSRGTSTSTTTSTARCSRCRRSGASRGADRTGRRDRGPAARATRRCGSSKRL